MHDDDEVEGRWIVRAKNRYGKEGFYGEGWQRRPGVLPYQGNAYRFLTENEALGAAYHARDMHYIAEFSVEELPPKPKFKRTPDGREGNG